MDAVNSAQKGLSNEGIALWLTPEQLAFIANEWRKIPENVPCYVKECWSEIAFKAITAMHNSGFVYEPVFADKGQSYHLIPFLANKLV